MGSMSTEDAFLVLYKDIGVDDCETAKSQFLLWIKNIDDSSIFYGKNWLYVWKIFILKRGYS